MNKSAPSGRIKSMPHGGQEGKRPTYPHKEKDGRFLYWWRPFSFATSTGTIAVDVGVVGSAGGMSAGSIAGRKR